jgi:hypothetical protein
MEEDREEDEVEGDSDSLSSVEVKGKVETGRMYGPTCCPSFGPCMEKYPECGNYSAWLCGCSVPVVLITAATGFVGSTSAACGMGGCCKCFFCCGEVANCCINPLPQSLLNSLSVFGSITGGCSLCYSFLCCAPTYTSGRSGCITLNKPPAGSPDSYTKDPGVTCCVDRWGQPCCCCLTEDCFEMFGNGLRGELAPPVPDSCMNWCMPCETFFGYYCGCAQCNVHVQRA